MPRKIKIGLLWHSASSGNLGVGALTIANLAIARTVAEGLGLEPHFTIIGMRDGDVRYLEPDQAEVFVVDRRSLLSPAGCWAVLGQQDCVLDIGGGDSFADIYGLKRFLYLWLTKLQTTVQNVPLLLSPQTIGPFDRKPYRQLARFALERARVVVARDEISLNCLRSMAPNANGRLSVDVAFALPYADNSANRGGERLKVGVNVSGLLFNEAESGKNRFGLDVDYADLSRRFITDLLERDGVEVHLVTHVSPMGEAWDDDGRVADRLAAEFPAVVRAPTFAGPCQAKSYISGLDFLIAGRMHACIAAFSSGVPVVPIAYSRKFTGLFGMLDYPWIVPVRGTDTAGAIAYLNDALDRRAELGMDTQLGMQKVEALLDVYRAELKDLFLSTKAAT